MLEHVFSPLTMRGKTLKNRLTVPAMVMNFCTADGKATERYIAYHEAKAKGGFGMIVTEDYAVEPEGKGFTNIPGLWSDDQIPGHTELANRVHKYDTVLIAQIYHAGRQTNSFITGHTPYAPSAIPCPVNQEMPEAMSIERVEEVIEKFGDTALRAKKCGFDGVEIHGAHGYLIAQFMSQYTNKRVDKYGGDLENRLRFPVEIIKNIRAKVGEDFIVGFKISSDEYMDGGRTLSDTLTIVPYLEEAGIDYVTVSAGVNGSATKMMPTSYTKHAWNVDAAEEVKKVCSIPVISVGRINDARIADTLIRAGKVDMVAMGRASLADPALPNKSKDGQLKDVRRCIGCLIGCVGNELKGIPCACALNPTLGREYEGDVEKAVVPKKLAVVGAGPAGLQAAITAAEAGHSVKVYEKSAYAGGQFRLAAVPPCKGEITEFINWQTTQLDKLNVEVAYETEVTADTFDAERPDTIVFAAGATPVVPPIPGVDLPHVVTAQDFLDGKVNYGNSCVVIGGGQVGAETANHLALNWKSVNVVEMQPAVAAEEVLVVRMEMMEDLVKNHVGMHTSTIVKKITETAVVCEKDGAEFELPADMVVIAVGSRANNALADALTAKGFDVKLIGDAEGSGNVMKAVTQGYDLAKTL